jgi:hypothetical protein
LVYAAEPLARVLVNESQPFVLARSVVKFVP